MAEAENVMGNNLVPNPNRDAKAQSTRPAGATASPSGAYSLSTNGGASISVSSVESDMPTQSPQSLREEYKRKVGEYHERKKNSYEKGSPEYNDMKQLVNEINAIKVKMDIANGYEIVRGYRLGETLGRGTFGIVKKATHQRTGQVIAMKFMHKDAKSFNHNIVLREIDCMQKVRHENVVRIFSKTMSCAYKGKNCVMIGMEFASGGDLYDVILHSGAMGEKLVRTYAKQLVAGVAAIHQVGIFHRDLKPSNILIGGNFNLKITDFGQSHIAPPGINLDRYKMLKPWVGTRGYRAPEMLWKRPYTRSVDVFALSVIFYMMACKRIPFKQAMLEDEWYINIAKKEITKFWKLHEGKIPNLSVDFRNMFISAVTYQPHERASLEQISGHEWMAGETYTDEERIEIMQTRHQQMQEAIINDPSRQSRLNSNFSASRRARIDNEDFDLSTIETIDHVKPAWMSLIIKEGKNLKKIFNFIQEEAAMKIHAEFEDDESGVGATGYYKAAVPAKGEAILTFHCRFVKTQDKNDETKLLFVFYCENTEWFEMPEQVQMVIVDALYALNVIDGPYIEKWVPESGETKDLDISELEKEDPYFEIEQTTEQEAVEEEVDAAAP